MPLSLVYKVQMEEFTDGLSTDIYTMRVLEVIKEGGFSSGLFRFVMQVSNTLT